MKSVAILGAGTEGVRLWEALSRCGSVEVVAFVDADARLHGRTRAGLPIHPPGWLATHAGDVATGQSAAGASYDLAWRLGIAADRIARLPTQLDDEALACAALARYPDPLAAALAVPGTPCGSSVGIFGTGAAGTRVWEAILDLDGLEPVWFADNNVRQQGREFLWLPVIAPAAIPAHRTDFVVVGSMSREPIRLQLLALGVSPQCILSPDVSAAVERVRSELARLVSTEGTREVFA